MLALQTTDNEFFELPDNVSLDVTGSNPAFDADAVGRVFSYPFLLPASPRNLRILKHANRLDAKRRTEANTSIPVKMWAAGAPLEAGYMKIGDVSDSALECSFANEASHILDMISETRIRALMPTVAIPQGEEGTWIFSILPVASPYEYRILINDVSYFYLADPGDDEFDAGVAIRDLINADYPGTTIVSGGDPTLEIRAGAFDPFVVSTFDGFTLDSYVTVGQAVQQNLIEYLTDLLATPADSHTFVMLRHQGFYGAGMNSAFTSFVNYYHNSILGENTPQDDPIWDYTYVPYVKLKYVFDQIAAELGIVWAGDFYESQDFADLRIFSNYALDKVRYEYFEVQHQYLNSFKTSFDLANHVPDITAQALLDSVFELFNVYPELRGTTMYLRRRRDQLTTPVQNFSAYMDPKYKMTVRPTKGTTLRFKDTQTIQTANPGQLDDYVIGDGRTLVEFSLYPLADSLFSDNVTDTVVRLAWVQEKGSSDELDTGINAFPLRIFFDRGIQDDLTSLPYSMSTHLDTDMADTVIGGLSLEWDGDNGLYAQHWQGWAELQDKQPLEMYAVVPVATARDMLKWEAPVIRFYHPLGESRAIVKNVQFDVGVEVMEWVKVKLEMIKL